MESTNHIVLSRCFQTKSLPTTGFSKEGRSNCGGQLFVMGLYHKPLPAAKILRHYFSYSKKTGKLFWRSSDHTNAKIGRELGTPHYITGYLFMCFKKDIYQVHRIIYCWVTGEDPAEFEVEHKNRNRVDNRFSNLRLATHSQNNCNTPLRKDNTSGHKGVSWSKSCRRWHAYITINQRRKTLGFFTSLEDAANAVRNLRPKLHQKFTNHG